MTGSAPATRGPDSFPLGGLHLVISGGCNLACAYCYQGPRGIPQRMPWDVARAALDFLLAEGQPTLTVDFGGGEPLLEFDLLRRCVEYVEAHRKGAVEYIVTTNGTLLTRRKYEFLASRGFSLRLSFDGPGSAQERRGPRTFEKLDSALKWMHAANADHFEKCVRIIAMLSPQTVGTWSESVRYFLDSGAPTVSFSPVMGGGEALTPEVGSLLGEQAHSVADTSAEHWKRTGRVPVAFLREPSLSPKPRSNGGFPCNAGAGGSLCVSTDGWCWTCPLFVPGLQRHTPLAAKAAEALHVGDVRAPDLRARLASVPERASAFPFLADRAALHSSFGKCGECELLADCSFCPASVSHDPGNKDPTRVPDFHCAFTRAKAEARRSFHDLTGGQAWLDRLERLEEALKNLACAIERDLGAKGEGNGVKGSGGQEVKGSK